ncbi:MAG: carboxylating nicotinate-nucleotide diphosphorylase [Nitrospinae bacterium]|nr:carboxylating nicotinate-nucleotide diphosphorylase [Nitrospinota bacterium]
MFLPIGIDEFIQNSLKEDIPNQDITTKIIVNEESVSKAVLIAKEEMVIAGLDIFQRVFHILNNDISVEIHYTEGSCVKKGDTILELKGNTHALLSGERVALNLLQRMCGIASLTKKFVDAIQNTNCRIADTRKTTPGLRSLEKYAVTIGGGINHRYSLSDAILIKENHIKAGGGIETTLKKVIKEKPHLMSFEIEVESIDELKTAIKYGAKNIMLDNFSPKSCKEAVEICQDKNITLETSGNISLENVRSYAETGVNIISVGKLTHSAPASDISLLIKEL